MADLSVPAKSFMLGEYVVLSGGPALVLCSAPRFALRVRHRERLPWDLPTMIHPASPAGKLVKRNLVFFKQYDFEFLDPYEGIGGLGASSAQFALLYAFQNQMKAMTYPQMEAMLSVYQELAWEGEGAIPSGVDVVAQFFGGLCLFHRNKGLLEALTWPFEDLVVCLLHTGNKIATHHYLRQFECSDSTELENEVNRAVTGLKTRNKPLFIEAFQHYGNLLDERSLVIEHTKGLLQQLKRESWVLAAKGCGALGADILCLLIDKNNTALMNAWSLQQGVRILFSGQHFNSGVEWTIPEKT